MLSPAVAAAYRVLRPSNASLCRSPVKDRIIETINVASTSVGATRFSKLLIADGLISLHDLAVAAEHATRGHSDLVDSVVTLGFMPEDASYDALSRSLGTDKVDLEHIGMSELAIRLVPERIARRIWSCRSRSTTAR